MDAYKKFILIIIMFALIFVISSCTNKKVEIEYPLVKILEEIRQESSEPIVIDYNKLSDNFIMEVKSDTKYSIQKDGREFLFGFTLYEGQKLEYSNVGIIWDEFVQKEHTVGSGSIRTSYLIRHNGNDFLYICGKSPDGSDATISYIDLSNKYLSALSVFKEFKEVPTSPENMNLSFHALNIKLSMYKDIGTRVVSTHFHPNDVGEPVMNNPDDEFLYYVEESKNFPLTLSQDIETEVFSSPDESSGTLTALPKGTKLVHYRTDDYRTVDMFLEDGRVARFDVIYLSSEPNSILQVNGITGSKLFDELYEK